MSQQKKIFTLKPGWRYYLIPYFISLLLLPVFGIGLLVFIYYYRRISKIEYAITDEDITVRNRNGSRSITLNTIHSLSITKTWAEKKSGLGTLHIHSEETEIQLKGIKQPEDIKDAIELALAAIEQRGKNKKKAENIYPNIQTGGLEHMNTLVGLWQQGLISDEDFEMEKQKFSKESKPGS